MSPSQAATLGLDAPDPAPARGVQTLARLGVVQGRQGPIHRLIVPGQVRREVVVFLAAQNKPPSSEPFPGRLLIHFFVIIHWPTP